MGDIVRSYYRSPLSPPNLGFNFLPEKTDPPFYFPVTSHLGRCMYKRQRGKRPREVREAEGVAHGPLNHSSFFTSFKKKQKKKKQEDLASSTTTSAARAATPPPWLPLAIAQLPPHTFVASVDSLAADAFRF